MSLRSKYAFLVLLLPLFFLMGCQDETNKAELWQGPYFSFRNYFTQQSNMHRKRKTILKKRIIKDGLTEIRNLERPNWEQELSLFLESDLNKKAWTSMYRIDSLIQENGLIVNYTTLDSNLSVKFASILLSNDTIQEVKIESRFENFYYHSSIWLQYQTGTGYCIRGEQSLSFLKSHLFEITGSFQPEQ